MKKQYCFKDKINCNYFSTNTKSTLKGRQRSGISILSTFFKTIRPHSFTKDKRNCNSFSSSTKCILNGRQRPGVSKVSKFF